VLGVDGLHELDGAGGVPVRGWQGTARYIYWVPEGRGFGRWARYDFLALSFDDPGGVVAGFGDTR
jgi:hypothetical protein